MLDEKFYVTEEGLKELKEEYENLVHVVRNEVIEDLKAARAQGDLSENADYDAARDKQAQVEARIKELEHMIRNAEVISENRGTSYVRLGSTVTVEPMDTHEKITFTIVGTVEADPLNGKVSNATPLAEAILEKKVGTVVTVEVDEPYDVKIVEIK
ncbi:MAG: transcription elongation factor GreA [Solobacterium sp.]|nr:transcription elongation factor GreA [Erysipelotrichaceae bacterium]MCI6699849.1 transcription elongation factor GreA [Solobacterium sp.]MCI7732244.1 transcription elongation factor GreA [Solobacterium sp.]MDD5843084.1 transcription elongation factor GreA [Solobacterium sp.]MDD5983545.1 transcription elongation factor GreA [Solobacterium sp.]